MAKDRAKKFNGRAFASTLAGISFVGMCITGIVLFVVPPGRVANWTGWTLGGLTKHQWQGLHIWFSLVFMVGACVHLVFNWRPLLSYFKSQVSKTLALRWEWALSLLVCLIVLAGVLADVSPFADLMAWNESIKHSWDDNAHQAPIPHAELLTLTELAGYVDGLTTETLLANLRAQGIAVESPEQVVGDLATANTLTPDALYRIAVGQTHSGSGRGGRQGAGGSGGHRGGQGFGRMTLKDYCANAGIEVNVAIEKLQKAGLTATETTTIREIADAANLHPSAVRQLLE